ncbi:methyltransferase [Caulobacter soli]|uniref:methyltransferase n=1 Tax=Caulobacter soli TaxID=2708539 RepID=UPI0013ECB612|nr:methyltransferase [Caulobacter soli]
MERSSALRALLAALDDQGYDFVTPTPSVCRRAAERKPAQDDPLRDVLGWSRAFDRQDLDPELFKLLAAGQVLTFEGERFISRVRVSRLDGMLFLHSAFPATAGDAVFLGPDSYRFARLIAQATAGDRVATIAEIGCGAGVGGLAAAKRFPDARLTLGDINPRALDVASINVAHAGVAFEARLSDGMAALEGPYDLIVANPPYVAGDSGRAYKDGGDLHGARLALDWSAQAMERLAPGGKFVLYTGSAILDGGVDAFRAALEGLVAGSPHHLTYEELDPDIFGGELRREAYADVERIAAIGAVVRRLA